MRTVFDEALAKVGAAYRAGLEDAMMGRTADYFRYSSHVEETAYREGYAKAATMTGKLLAAAKAAREAAERGFVVADGGRLEVVA
jgi:hypothetical protein